MKIYYTTSDIDQIIAEATQNLYEENEGWVTENIIVPDVSEFLTEDEINQVYIDYNELNSSLDVLSLVTVSFTAEYKDLKMHHQ